MREPTEREIRRLQDIYAEIEKGNTPEKVIAQALELAGTYRDDGAPQTAAEIETAVDGYRQIESAA